MILLYLKRYIMKKFLVILMLVSVLAVAAFSQNKPGSYIVRSQNWEYGLLDSVGNVLIPVEFSRISSLKSGFLKVCDKEGCSMYRADGELVLGEKVYDIEVFNNGCYAVCETTESEWIVYNPDGEPVSQRKFSRLNFSDAGFGFGNDTDKKSWIITPEGELISISDQRDIFWNFFMAYSDSVASTWTRKPDSIVVVALRNGKPHLNFYKANYVMPKYGGAIVVIIPGGECIMVGPDGKVIVPAGYKWFGEFHPPLILIHRKDGSYGYYDVAKGEEFPGIFEFAADFNGGYAQVANGGKYGMINLKGEYVIPMKYDFVYPYEGEPILVKSGEKYGLVKLDDEVVVDCIYDYIYPFGDGLAKVFLNGKYGVIDSSGKVVIPLDYDQIAVFSKDVILLGSGSNWKCINSQGQLLSGVDTGSYAVKALFNGNRLLVCRDGKYGVVDFQGNIIIPIIYDSIEEV